MNREVVSKTQLHDAYGQFIDAAHNFDKMDIQDEQTIPRPTIGDVAKWAQEHKIVISQGTFPGALMLGPMRGGDDVRKHFPGLRGIAYYKTPRGVNVAPAIVLRDGENAALLTADANPRVMDAVKHSLLENIYTTQNPNIVAHGVKGVAPTVGGHALVAASFIGNPLGAHNRVHTLGKNNFGTGFDNSGARDITFGAAGHDVLRVRSAVLPLDQIVLEVADIFQANPGEDLLGAGMNAGDLNVAMTVAATLSRHPSIDLGANMEAMSSK